jgi:hypothetical protein
MKNAPPLDGDPVPLAVEYLVRLAIRWALYALAATFAVVAVIAAWASLHWIIVGLFAVACCALAILGRACDPRRKRPPPDNPAGA